KLPVCQIPRDVKTRWNSTYKMSKFALEYRSTIDAITADKSLKLRKYELDKEEWLIVEELNVILKVNNLASMCKCSAIISYTPLAGEGHGWQYDPIGLDTLRREEFIISHFHCLVAV
ncbi:uncharacterized protein B0H18DRAFT_868666, partial [Fomitopsis serialis]|uniref:uncharacterized protein n=1 Tax=Fomitopsis serialis TaxID=139415 RepID=UPI0020084845